MTKEEENYLLQLQVQWIKSLQLAQDCGLQAQLWTLRASTNEVKARAESQLT